LLAEYPQGYSIDRHNLTLNPLGLHGRKFEGDLLLVSAKSGYIDNMIKAVEQAGLDIVDVVFSGIAAAEAVLTREDKEKGAVVVDIGDCLTGILIFKDSVVRKLNVLTFGGKNLSEIISNYFKLPLELADEIKESSLELGVDFQDTEEVMIKTEYAYKPIKKKELAGIVQPEIDRFVVMLKDFISQSGVEGIAASRIVVTGGVSLLEGLLEKMERDLGMPVSLGLTKGHSNMPLSKAPAYACAIGLLHLQNDAYSARGHKLHGEGKNRLSKMVDYVVNIYQDYF
jgi:cell division protein FtsA